MNNILLDPGFNLEFTSAVAINVDSAIADSVKPTSILLKNKSYCANNEIVVIIILFDALTAKVIRIMIRIEYKIYVFPKIFWFAICKDKLIIYK